MTDPSDFPARAARASAKLILVTGGSRSGKSRWAQATAEALAPQRVYLATCPRIDAEMDARIDRHQRDRAGRAWQTVEEELDIAAAITAASAAAVVLVDCLTLWCNNLLYQAEREGRDFTEDAAVSVCGPLISACRARQAPVILVSNEVGMGLIAASASNRRFVDCAGRINQCLAAAADRVVLLVSGCPLAIKGSGG